MNELENKPITNQFCRRCGGGATVTKDGFIHTGGGMYVQKCETCGWMGGRPGSYQACPNCGETKRLMDDHVILV